MAFRSSIFLFGILLAMVFGYGFAAFSEGFADGRISGTRYGLCEDYQSSSQDDNVTPLIAVFLLVPFIVRIIRFRKPFGFFELVGFWLIAIFELMIVAGVRNCADFGATLLVARNTWFWGFLGGHVLAVSAVILPLEKLAPGFRKP